VGFLLCVNAISADNWKPETSFLEVYDNNDKAKHKKKQANGLDNPTIITIMLLQVGTW
jgi:hypothetical protein